MAAEGFGKDAWLLCDTALRDELNWAKWFVNQDHPRILEAGMRQNKIVIFTDASLEGNDEVAGIGMVAFVVENSTVAHKFFFSERVPANILNSWQTRTKKIIASLELFAAVAACEILGERFPGLCTFVYIDNEAARASLIAMYSTVLLHITLLKQLSFCSLKRNLFMWIARVPSSSNCADFPSRFIFDHLISEGFARVAVKWPAP